MKTKEAKIDRYTRQSAYSNLKSFDVTAEDDGFIEVTIWKNWEGFDVEIESYGHTRFQLTFGQFDALKALVKKLNSTTDGV